MPRRPRLERHPASIRQLNRGGDREGNAPRAVRGPRHLTARDPARCEPACRLRAALAGRRRLAGPPRSRRRPTAAVGPTGDRAEGRLQDTQPSSTPHAGWHQCCVSGPRWRAAARPMEQRSSPPCRHECVRSLHVTLRPLEAFRTPALHRPAAPAAQDLRLAAPPAAARRPCVEEDELLAAVWPGVMVTERSLTRCINVLR